MSNRSFTWILREIEKKKKVTELQQIKKVYQDRLPLSVPKFCSTFLCKLPFLVSSPAVVGGSDYQTSVFTVTQHL